MDRKEPKDIIVDQDSKQVNLTVKIDMKEFEELIDAKKPKYIPYKVIGVIFLYNMVRIITNVITGYCWQ